MSAWLHIIGVSERGVEALDAKARNLITAAKTVFGPPRFDVGMPKGQMLTQWQTPIDAMIKQVLAERGNPTVVLATGDPGWFGIGATLGKHLEPSEFTLHSTPSAFQLAAARMHWPLQNVANISLHGRAVETVHRHLTPANRILALTSNAGTLNAVASILTACGYGKSMLTVLENLGGEDERITQFTADEADAQNVGDFYTLAIDCVADNGAPLLPAMPGLPDSAFISDGQLTKREVRAATLAKLAPYPGALLWDVGAGSGSVAIEWMRAADRAEAICFERDARRIEMIEKNRMALGTPSLEIVSGSALENLADQPAPDAIFLGGGVADQPLFERCWQALKPGGRLVANAVTIASEQALYQRQETYGGELVRIAISVLGEIGPQRAMTPRRTVTQWLAIKEVDA